MSIAALLPADEAESGPATMWGRDGTDFSAPLFDAVRRQLDALQDPFDLAALNALAMHGLRVVSAGGKPVRFVAPASREAKGVRAADAPYEERVYHDGEVETRPGNWHDAFNAMAWLAWPRTKAALNAVHFHHRLEGGGPRRSVARDVATLFDEEGAVIACSDPALASLVHGFRWKEVFCERRAQVLARMRCFLVGHALLDKSRAPYKAMTAHCLIFPVSQEFLSQPVSLQVAALDALAASWFADAANLASTSQLAPLPVLGFPGFFEANADPGFYDDSRVFRPGRMRSTQVQVAQQ